MYYIPQGWDTCTLLHVGSKRQLVQSARILSLRDDESTSVLTCPQGSCPPLPYMGNKPHIWKRWTTPHREGSEWMVHSLITYTCGSLIPRPFHSQCHGRPGKLIVCSDIRGHWVGMKIWANVYIQDVVMPPLILLIPPHPFCFDVVIFWLPPPIPVSFEEKPEYMCISLWWSTF